MIRYAVKPHMDRKGWQNANQLAEGADIPPPLAYRVLAGEPLERIEVRTLERLALAFGLTDSKGRKAIWQLLEYIPDE